MTPSIQLTRVFEQPADIAGESRSLRSPLVALALDGYSLVERFPGVVSHANLLIRSSIASPEKAKKPVDGCKIEKSGLGACHGDSTTFEQAHTLYQKRYPGVPYSHVGSLEQGLVFYANDPQTPLKIMTLAGAFNYAKTPITDASGQVVDYIFGKVAPASEFKFPIITTDSPEARHINKKIAEFLRTTDKHISEVTQDDLHGALMIGPEAEIWVGRDDGRLIDESLGEVLRGCLEDSRDKIYTDLVQAGKDIASIMDVREREMFERFGEEIIFVCLSALSFGNPDDAIIDIDDDYMLTVSRRLVKQYGIPVGRDDIQQLMDKLARRHGHADFSAMAKAHNSYQAWAYAANQFSVGVPHYTDPETGEPRADGTILVQLADLLASELAAPIRMLCASSPLMFGEPIELDGKIGQDWREVTRDLLQTAKAQNRRIRTPERLLEIYKQTILKADRLDRAGSAYSTFETDAEGNTTEIFTPTAHGLIRLRITETTKQGVVQPSARIEVTAPGATSILPTVRAAAIAQIFSAYVQLAGDQGVDVFDYISQKTGLSEDDLFGNNERAALDFNWNDGSAPHAKAALDKLEIVVRALDESPLMEPVKAVALQAIASLRKQKTITEFCQSGLGSLGGALREFVKQGYTDIEITKLAAAQQKQERAFLETLKTWDEQFKWATGQIGFEFIWPASVPKRS